MQLDWVAVPGPALFPIWDDGAERHRPHEERQTPAAHVSSGPRPSTSCATPVSQATGTAPALVNSSIPVDSGSGGFGRLSAAPCAGLSHRVSVLFPADARCEGTVRSV